MADCFITARRVCIARIMPLKDVCLSVCPSVTRRYCVYTYPRSFISYPGSPIILVFHTKRDGNIPTGTPPLTEATNAKGYKNHDFQPISCFILQTMQDRAIVSLEGE